MDRRLGLVAACVAAWISAAVACGSEEGTPRFRPVPLGGSLSADPPDRHFGVYVPTRSGGVLSVEATSGTVGLLAGPDGRDRPNGQEIGPGAPGWYTFEVRGAEAGLSVSTSFVQIGQSARRPWNFYYWPTKSDAIHEPWSGGNGRVDTTRAHGDDVLVASPGGPIGPGQDIVRAGPNGRLETPVAPGDDSTWFPNLYDDATFSGADGAVYQTPCPLLKYDQFFRSSARAWEASHAQNSGITRWPGHCLGGAVASILLNEPTPAPGSGLSRDELKALWAELGEDHLNHAIGEHVTDIPAGPPIPGPDPCDRSVARFHRLLEGQLRGRRQALLGNLRAFPPRGTPDEVWNHGIGRYTARYRVFPGRDVRTVLLDVEIEANSGSSLNGQDEQPRLIRYTYALAYDRDGQVDEARVDASDWISVGGEAIYAPLNLMEVRNTRWSGHNPHVTEANVRGIDLANGGDPARYPGSPPQFLPAALAKSSPRRRLASGRDPEGTPRRGGLLRRINAR